MNRKLVGYEAPCKSKNQRSGAHANSSGLNSWKQRQERRNRRLARPL